MRMLPTPARRRLPARPGFSFVELMVAMTVAAAIMAIAYPRMIPVRDSAGVRSAKQALMAHLTTARQSAVRRGTMTAFHRSGNTIHVGGSTAATRVLPQVDLLAQHGVTLTTDVALDSVRFTGRGLANPRLGSAVKLKLSRGASTDSLCLNRLGMIAKCGL